MQDRIRWTTQRITGAFGSARIFWLVIALALGCALFLVSQNLQPSDDAYITFRHVKNLLEHGRPAWNLAGDPVLGSTSPAFLLVLALFCKVLGLEQIDRAALYLNAVFHFVIVVLTYLVAKNLVRRVLPSVLVALLVGLNAVNVYIFSQGFENAMLVASLLGSLYFLRVGREGYSVGLASLAPLIRPEGILLTPVVWGYILLRKRFNKKLLLAFLPIPLLWLAFSTAYYGSPVPHSLLAAKKFPLVYRPYTEAEVSLVRRLPEVFSRTAQLWNEPAGPLLLTGAASGEVESTAQTYRQWIMLLGLPLAVLSVIGRSDGRIVYWLYAPLFLLFYGWIGHTRPWYFPSFLTFSIVLLFTGWIRALDWGLERIKPHTGDWISRLRVGLILNLALFVVFATANSYSVNHGEYRHSGRGFLFPQHPWGGLWDLWEAQRYHEYRRAAEYLESRTGSHEVALISEVGVFGYFYSGDVIDTVGLCSPEALAFYPPPKSDIHDPEGHPYTKANTLTPSNMVKALKPDWVVNSRFYIANLLRPGSPFLDEYEEVFRGGRVWGEPLLIYRRFGTREADDPAGSRPTRP